MQIYEFAAPYHEIGHAERFLGFANNATEQYLWVQRDECSEDEIVPQAGNIWIERDDQQWGGPGGITGVEMNNETLSFQLTPDKAMQMGGFDELRVRFALTVEEFVAIRDQLLRVFVGYESIVCLPAEPSAAGGGIV